MVISWRKLPETSATISTIMILDQLRNLTIAPSDSAILDRGNNLYYRWTICKAVPARLQALILERRPQMTVFVAGEGFPGVMLVPGLIRIVEPVYQPQSSTTAGYVYHDLCNVAFCNITSTSRSAGGENVG